MNSDDQEQVHDSTASPPPAKNKCKSKSTAHGANLSVGFASFYVILRTRTYVESPFLFYHRPLDRY